MEITNVQDAPEIIVAACVLHNICLLDEDSIEDFLDDSDDDDEDDGDDDIDDLFPAGAQDKRNEIMRNLP